MKNVHIQSNLYVSQWLLGLYIKPGASTQQSLFLNPNTFLPQKSIGLLFVCLLGEFCCLLSEQRDSLEGGGGFDLKRLSPV